MSARRLALAAATCLAALLGCAAHRPSSGTAPVASTARSTLLSTRCGSCHKVPNPAAMPAEEWIAALDRMKRRIRLAPADWDSLAAMAVDDTTSATH